MNIQPHEARRWVHRSNSSAAILLLITGTLVTFPDLRIAIYGSGGQVLSDIHLWTGAVFVSAPILALLLVGSSVMSNLKKRIFDSKTVHWRRVHLCMSLASCLMMGATGPIMWLDSIFELPIVLMDAIFLVHLSFAWVLGLTLPVHLWMARRGIVRVTKTWLRMNNKPSKRPLATATVTAPTPATPSTKKDNLSDRETHTITNMEANLIQGT